MAYLIFCILLLCQGLVQGKPATTNEPDSYAIIPSKQQQSQDNLPPNSELNLEILPPAINGSSPHVYYMNKEGMAEPADEKEEIQQRRKRALVDNQIVPENSGESMKADETIIIGPPSGRPFGYPAIGFRPSQARNIRKYHNYPWHYH